MAGKPGRISLLLARLAARMATVDWHNVSIAGVKEKLSVFARLATAYVNGRYRAVSWKSMLIVLGALIYFVSPLDFIPDVIPVAGLTDDFSILLWVYSTVRHEVDKFTAWERSIKTPAVR